MINGERPTPTLADLTPGCVGFGPIGGAAGLLVGAGQLILGHATRAEWRVRHVFVVTEGVGFEHPYRDGPRIVQAMPSGAEEIEIGAEHWTKEYIYLRPAYKVAGVGYGGMAQEVASWARRYVGTPYSFLDYAALAGLHLGIKNGPIRRRVSRSKNMICSQLADQAMSDAGWHVFDDGRLPQDVTPAALYRQMMSMPGEHLVPGGDWHPNVGPHSH